MVAVKQLCANSVATLVVLRTTTVFGHLPVGSGSPVRAVAKRFRVVPTKKPVVLPADPVCSGQKSAVRPSYKTV